MRLFCRPPSERAALARAFIAKSVFNLPTTRRLRAQLQTDAALRLLCGWQPAGEVPREATFSRAVGEFARSTLAERLHEAVIKAAYKDELVGHISRDSTAIEGREKPKPPAAPPTAAPPQNVAAVAGPAAAHRLRRPNPSGAWRA